MSVPLPEIEGKLMWRPAYWSITLDSAGVHDFVRFRVDDTTDRHAAILFEKEEPCREFLRRQQASAEETRDPTCRRHDAWQAVSLPMNVACEMIGKAMQAGLKWIIAPLDGQPFAMGTFHSFDILDQFSNLSDIPMAAFENWTRG